MVSGSRQKEKERSDSLQRVKRLLQGESIDRIPFFTFTLGFCAKNAGLPTSTIYSSPEKSIKAQLQTMEQYGYDTTPFYGYASYGGAEFGGSIKLPESQYEQAPAHGDFAVACEEDLEKLSSPDVTKAGFIPLAFEFSLLQQKYHLPVSLVIGGPFTVAGNICPVPTLCRWLVKKPEAANRLLRIATDHLKDIIEHWVRTFGSKKVDVQIWEPLSANQIISPRQFEKFVFPFQKELNEHALASGLNSLLLHVCGEQNRNLPYWSQLPLDDRTIISIGVEVDIDAAIAHFGKNCIIAGNIDPTLIQTSTPEELYELCRITIEKGKRASRGFILMPGCEIPIGTPPYNMYTMVKALDDFGYY